MIEVESTTALLLYLGLFLTICFSAWGISHLKNRHKKILPPLFQLITCEFCHYQYLAKNGEKISQCKQCSSYNKQNNV